jgi:hypothetical protein
MQLIPPIVIPDWDADQRAVIEVDEEDFMLVDAGPGAGKTAVACARVAYLIEACSLEASKIFLISFTRAAVKELRDRIEGFAQNPISVAGLQIVTLDSFTWQVVKGIGEKDPSEMLTSYEGNIKSFVTMLREKDPILLDYLSELEHVIMDEGQDLVGVRADLALEIVRSLSPECGVTVFADSAQAIYGFTDDSDEHGRLNSPTAVERIESGEVAGFEVLKLNAVHRTEDPRLRMLFTEGRTKLLALKESTPEGWKETKEMISRYAHGPVGDIEAQSLADRSDILILYRTRAEVLMDSSILWNSKVSHKLRMSRISSRIAPWIGRLLAEYDEDILTKPQFDDLWRMRVQDSCTMVLPDPDQCWELLFNYVGNKSLGVKLTRLRELLSRDRPPVDFIVDERELPGPTLGTIHASKGRESAEVHLMMPPDKFIKPPYNPPAPPEIAEEERVLFVGATRARKTLLVGKGKCLNGRSLNSGRVFRKVQRFAGGCARQVEIGLQGDFDVRALADGEMARVKVADLQEWLWTQANCVNQLESKYDIEKRVGRLSLDGDGGRPIGFLTKGVGYDLFEVANRIQEKEGCGPLKPASTIKNIRMVGVTTVVLPAKERETLLSPWRHSGFLLAPIITGFPLVFFNPRS